MRGEDVFRQDPDGGLARRLRERANPHSLAPASFYAVTSYDESVVEFFKLREDAERFIERCQDDPELAAELRVEVLEVEQSLN